MAGKKENQAIATRYAIALFTLAQDEKSLDKVSNDLADIQTLLAESDIFTEFVYNKVLPRKVQIETLSNIANKAKFSDITKKFLGLLAEKRRLYLLENIIIAVEDEIALFKNEVTAEVTSASKLNKEQTKGIKSSLSASLGKTVILETTQDKEIIGGLLIKVGSKLIDSSVRSKLKRLHSNLKSSNTLAEKISLREVA